MANTIASQVQELYVGYLGRAAEKAGLDYWVNQVSTGKATIQAVAQAFTVSTEYTTAYANLTTAQLVAKVYQNVLGRAGEAAGLAYWEAQITSGKITAGQLVNTMLNNLGSIDQATINNKVFVAQTYTDTAGASYNVAAGTASIVGVNNTAASVSTAIDKITAGTLPGTVPGVAAIKALDAAQTGLTTFEAANKATADALVAKLDAAHANVAAGAPGETLTDKIVAGSSYQAKVDAVVADAALIRGEIGGGATTTVLTTDASDKAATALTAFNALSAAAKVQANALVSAIAAEATAKAAAATAVQKAAVEAGLATDAPTLIGTGLAYANAAAVYAAYVQGNTDARTAIDTQFKNSAYYSTFKATVAKDAAYADALKATAAAKDALDSNNTAEAIATQVNGITITAAADTATGTGDTYIAALNAKTVADTTLAAAKAADADVASAKALADAYAVPKAAVATAQTAVDAIAVPGEVALVKLTGAATPQTGTGTVAAPIKDVFYFADKAAAANAGGDFAIASFAAGDSIVLGSGFTFNSGALSTGNGNALEFFLVQKGGDTLVVLETTAFGSSTTTNTATGAGAIVSDHAAVITLTGVTLDHVAVANGVISYV